jgi:hypothetical protein
MNARRSGEQPLALVVPDGGGPDAGASGELTDLHGLDFECT